MNIDEQIHFVNLGTTDLDVVNKLCDHMPNCPPSRHFNCNNCIGDIPMAVLEKMEPELNRDNLKATLKVWEVLFK